MEVSKEYLPCTQQPDFLMLRFFYFHNKLSFGEDFLRTSKQHRTGLHVVCIKVTASLSRTSFHKYEVTTLYELIRSRRQKTDTVLIGKLQQCGWCHCCDPTDCRNP